MFDARRPIRLSSPWESIHSPGSGPSRAVLAGASVNGGRLYPQGDAGWRAGAGRFCGGYAGGATCERRTEPPRIF
jgi:hypothetical protein